MAIRGLIFSAALLTACANSNAQNDDAVIDQVAPVEASTEVQAEDDGPVEAEPVPVPEGWQLVWSDEFSGTEIDASKWSHEVDCWGGGNDERQCYTDRPDNSSVSDGVLSITARLEPAAGPALPARLRENASEEERNAVKEQLFTSARLVTLDKADWLYGRFEFRAKLPGGQGVWPALWMLPSEELYGAWAASGEIDVLEAVNLGTECSECDGGVENRIIGTIHHGGEWPKNRYTGQDTVLPVTEDGFNTFAVEWQEGQIDWFVDDIKYFTLTSDDWRSRALFSRLPETAPFDQPFYLIMNVAIGGHLSESRNEGGVDLTGYPKSMLVDWVRVYQRDDGSPSP